MGGKYKFLVLIFFVTLSLAYSQDSNGQKIEEIPVDTNRLYSSYEVEIEPKFPAGKDSLSSFIRENFKLTRNDWEFEGIVCLCFTINRQGKIVNHFIPGGSGLFESAFENLIQKMPNWIPGKKKGIAVKTIICYPLMIKLR